MPEYENKLTPEELEQLRELLKNKNAFSELGPPKLLAQNPPHIYREMPRVPLSFAKRFKYIMFSEIEEELFTNTYEEIMKVYAEDIEKGKQILQEILKKKKEEHNEETNS